MMTFILYTGIVLAIFLGFLLLTKKSKQLPDRLLGCWLFAIALQLLNYLFAVIGVWNDYPHLIGTGAPLPFLHGPLLFLYVSYSQKNRKHLRPGDYLHFLPVVLFYVYLIPFFFTYTAAEKLAVDQGVDSTYELFITGSGLAMIASGLIYVLLSYLKLIRRRRLIGENFSSDDRISLNWLRYAILSFGSSFLIAGLVIVLREIFGLAISSRLDLVFYAIMVIFVVYLGYSGVRQQGIFSSDKLDEADLVNPESRQAYQHSGLKPDVARQKHQELLKLMAAEKPFLNATLTLHDLAVMLSLSSNHLSQIINQQEGMNFHDFVNRYRVEEFISRANSNPSFSLLAHAFDSGFNSKSSFNSVFKRVTGKTPSQFLSRNKA